MNLIKDKAESRINSLKKGTSPKRVTKSRKRIKKSLSKKYKSKKSRKRRSKKSRKRRSIIIIN